MDPERGLGDVGQVTARTLRQWQDDMDLGAPAGLTDAGRRVAFATANRRISGLASFLRWAYYQAVIPRPVDVPGRIRGPRHRPGWLVRGEKNALLDAVEHAPARDRAVIVLLLNTGLRVSELSNLKWPDVELRERKGALTIRGKGGKYRHVRVNLECRRALMDLGWEQHRGTDRHVVPGERLGGLGVRGIQGLATRYGKRAGIEGFHAHRLRHTFAHDLAAAGVAREVIAAQLGHASLDTTRLYLESSEEEEQRAVDLLSGRVEREEPRPRHRRRA